MGVEYPLGDMRFAELISKEDSETRRAVAALIVSAVPSIVSVVTAGSDPRPNAPTVLWISPVQPTNILPHDLWANSTTGSITMHLDTTPAPDTSTMFSAFGTSYPFTLTKGQDTPLKVATAFYTYGAPATGWKTSGARLYVPAGITLPSSASFELRQVDASTAVDLSSTPVSAKTMTSITTGWNEIVWDTPVVATPGQYQWISYDFGDGEYISAPSTSDSYTASTTTSNLVEADGVSGFVMRSAYQYASGAKGQSKNHYGIDILISKT